MEKYKIGRIGDCGCVVPEKECFEVNGKKYVIDFGGKGPVETSDKDVAEYYCHRNFPNSVPDGTRPAYTVCKWEGGEWIKVN